MKTKIGLSKLKIPRSFNKKDAYGASKYSDRDENTVVNRDVPAL